MKNIIKVLFKVIKIFLILIITIIIQYSSSQIKAPMLYNYDVIESNYVINGIDLKKYYLVYPQNPTEFEIDAVNYLKAEIYRKTQVELCMISDVFSETKAEILVGNTNRTQSNIAKNTARKKLESVLIFDENVIALDGFTYMIANSARYFVSNIIESEPFNIEILPRSLIIEPTFYNPKNVILLIGDGMGQNHVRLVNSFSGVDLPNCGLVTTNSLTGITDSAAAATALATGYKTLNGKVGVDKENNILKSITETSLDLQMKAAIFSTDSNIGATPASFTSHANNREDFNDIKRCQQELLDTNKIVIECSLVKEQNSQRRQIIKNSLMEINNDQGIFVMYEEAYIDINSHKNKLDQVLNAVNNYNYIIQFFIEYVLYNPDTVLIITADHETGGLYKNAQDQWEFTTTGHTESLVPIYAIGYKTDLFNNKTVDNTEVAQFIFKIINHEI